MIRRSSGFQPFVVVCVAVFFVITIRPEAQTPLLTRHVREAVADGKAPLVGHLPADRPMRLVLVLPLRDREGLETFLQEVDDPSSPAYHRFLTVEEFAERFGPTQSDYESVIHFAEPAESGCYRAGCGNRASLAYHNGRVPASHGRPDFLRSGS
jgi:hypothetical protein